MRKVLLTAAAAAALATALPALAETVAITHARILTAAGPEIAQGTVVLKDGKIVAVGASAAVPAGARVIDAAGGGVTPGLFSTGSLLGAVEVSAVGNDVTVDNPALGAAFDLQYGLDPNSTLIPVARLGGLTSAVVLPHSYAERGEDEEEGDELTAGGGDSGPRSHALFAGQGVVVDLGGRAEMVTRAKVGMVVPFGKAGATIAGGSRGAEIVAFKTALADVRDYMKNKAAYDRAGYRQLDLSKADLEALIPVVQGRMPVIATVHKAADIRAVIRLAREENLKLILNGAEEGWLVADEIAKAGVPVLTNPLDDRPESFELLASTMDNVARLNAAGVMVAIEASEGGAHRAREARYDAGNAVSHGMPYGAALAALTINPAKIFGVGDRTGSLEAGKDADVVIWTGDPFEPLSQPTAVFIKGVQQPMTSRQIELRDRYKDLHRDLPPGYTH